MTPYTTVRLADQLSAACAALKGEAADLGVRVERGDDITERLRVINRMAHHVLTRASVLRIALDTSTPKSVEHHNV